MSLSSVLDDNEIAEVLKAFELVENKLVVGYEVKNGELIPIITITTVYKQKKSKKPSNEPSKF